MNPQEIAPDQPTAQPTSSAPTASATPLTTVPEPSVIAPASASSESPATPTQPKVDPASIYPTPASPTSPSQPKVDKWDSISTSDPSGNKFNLISLILAALAVISCLVLIFVPSLVGSITLAYVWFFVIFGLGAAALVLGLLHQKSIERVHLGSLVGIILGTIICLNALFVGAYYIKYVKPFVDAASSISTGSESGSSDLNFK